MLTIVIASYNHEEYIQECLNEAYKINIENRKILVIDDGSIDSTPKIVRNFIHQHNAESEIQLMEKPNSGLVSSLNLAMTMVNTPYVYFTASDDIPVPAGIEKLVQMMESDKKINFIIGGANNLFEDGKTTPAYTKAHNHFFALQPQKLIRNLFLDYPSPILLQSSVFKTDIIRKVGGWDKGIRWDDYPLWIKLLENQISERKAIRYEPAILCVFYRHHTYNTYKNIIKQFSMVQEGLQRYAPRRLRNHAIGNALSFYMMICIKQRDFTTLLQLTRAISIKNCIYILNHTIKLILRRFIK